MMKSKKIFSILFALTLIFSTATSAFAAVSEVQPESSSDRFRYEYVTTPLTLVNTYTITEEQAKDASNARAAASAIIGNLGLLGAATDLTIQIGNAIYNMNGPGTMKVYESTKTQYKINLVTGNRSIVGKWRTDVFKLYDKSGTLKNTREHTMREK